MPRAPRVFVEGGIYHVYNRVTRGEGAFAEDGEAERFVELVREVKKRDGLVVLAWCVMSNHYHLAVRCTSVPLWRSLASVQLKATRAYNAHYRVHGPFWQGRYKAKLVDEPDYLRQLILYVHLNPVVAGIVKKPEEYVWSGHREVVRKIREPLVDSDQLLLVFGETRRTARRTYLESIRATKDAPWAGEAPGGLPWWRFGRPREEKQDEELRMSATPFIDELGRSTAIERPRLNEKDFIDRVLEAVNINITEVVGRTKRSEVVRAREILLVLGVERYGLRVKDLASALGVRYDTASLWGRRGAKRRAEDDRFRSQLEEVDAILASSKPSQWDNVTSHRE
jgi:REP element-mobilizing transposase RayT